MPDGGKNEEYTKVRLYSHVWQKLNCFLLTSVITSSWDLINSFRSWKIRGTRGRLASLVNAQHQFRSSLSLPSCGSEGCVPAPLSTEILRMLPVMDHRSYRGERRESWRTFCLRDGNSPPFQKKRTRPSYSTREKVRRSTVSGYRFICLNLRGNDPLNFAI